MVFIGDKKFKEEVVYRNILTGQKANGKVLNECVKLIKDKKLKRLFIKSHKKD